MEDLRLNKIKVSFKGNLINNSCDCYIKDVKEILDFMDISYNDEMVEEIVCYLLHNSMSTNANTVEGYLNSVKNKKLDMRKKN